MSASALWHLLRKQPVTPEDDERPPEEAVNLHQELPPVFDRTLSALLGRGEEPLAVLYVPSERILEWMPGRALVLMEDGVLFMEEGESVILDQKWGVKSLFYPYSQIAGIGLGQVLLRGRFTLHSAGDAPSCSLILHWYDLNNFRAAARLIRSKVGQPLPATGDRASTAQSGGEPSLGLGDKEQGHEDRGTGQEAADLRG